MKSTDTIARRDVEKALKRVGDGYSQNVSVEESRAHNATISFTLEGNEKVLVKARALTQDYMPCKGAEDIRRRKACANVPPIYLLTASRLASVVAREADERMRPETRGSPEWEQCKFSDVLKEKVAEFTADDFPRFPKSFDETAKYLVNMIGKRMDAYGGSISDADMHVIYEDCVEHAFESGHAKRTKDGRKLEKNYDTARAGVCRRFNRAKDIFYAIREKDPDCLPDVKFPNITPPRVSQGEQIKDFEHEIRVKVYAILLRILEEGVLLAGPALLAHLCGLRVAEAAGVRACDVQSICEECDSIWIGGQARGGVRKATTKSASGKRLVPLTDEATYVVAKRMRFLLEKMGGDLGEIPLWSPDANNCVYYNERQVSALLVDALVRAGCDERYCMARQREIGGKAGEPAGLVAHQARHAFFSRMLNCCGMPQQLADAIGGHALGQSAQVPDTLTENAVSGLREMLRNCPFDPDITKSCACTPIKIGPNEHYSGKDVPAICIEAEEDGIYAVNLFTREPGDCIRITGSVECLPKESIKRYTQPCNKRSDYTVTVGKWVRPEILRKWKAEVQQMDLTDLLQKYGQTTQKAGMLENDKMPE